MKWTKGLLRSRRFHTLSMGAAALVLLSSLTRAPVPAEVPDLSDVDPSVAAVETAILVEEAGLAGDDPEEAVAELEADPSAAVERMDSVPGQDAGSLESALRGLRDNPRAMDPVDMQEFFASLGEETDDWLAVLYPDTMMRLDGVPFSSKRLSSRIMTVAAEEVSKEPTYPQRPWTGGERPPRGDLGAVRESGRDFLYVDPYLNDGHGSWVEVVGDMESAEKVSILVPGSAATIDNHNFDLYQWRAQSLVDASDGDLAVIVWAGAPWPSGWVESSWANWAEIAGERLARFSEDVAAQYPDKYMTVVGHSYGGAVVGEAERHQMAGERVLQVASAGMGHEVAGPGDYSDPCRERYSMTAEGDPISYIQGLPYMPLLGHGEDPDEFPGVTVLDPGYLSADPGAVDDSGNSLAAQGILGKKIEGVHSHSEVFYPGSDSWKNIYAVMTGGEPEAADDQPEAYPACSPARE
ncbi:alpha/beta hydrolase [Salininema proteolyticum]|uniref:Alpha/beta hydrolase n=1 Tax=Salininema proteolyticum TaxID=1607685 RepID=A0ABV8U0S0_9ACTN